jgi:hypothetical protein
VTKGAGQRRATAGVTDLHDVIGAVTWRVAPAAWPVRGFHSRTLPSVPAVAITLPSGLNATPFTPPKVSAPPGENVTPAWGWTKTGAPAGGHGRICGEETAGPHGLAGEGHHWGADSAGGVREPGIGAVAGVGEEATA